MTQLAPLVLDLHVNATDADLLANLRACDKLDLPWVDVHAPRDRPLAICGAGASLGDTFREIPEGADVMALNGAYQFLLHQGLTPKFFACLDAREANVRFVRDTHPDTIFLLASQCHPAMFEALKGRSVYVFHLHTPTTEQVFGQTVTRVGAASTMGLTALMLAGTLGYRALYLFGYDSSYRGKATHVTPEAAVNAPGDLVVWLGDVPYRTSHAMAGQVADFLTVHQLVRRQWPDLTVDVNGTGLFYDHVRRANATRRTRETEVAKYATAYQVDTYSMQHRLTDAAAALRDLPCRGSYLDVSTGRGEMLGTAKALGFDLVRGTETVRALLGPDVSYGVLPTLAFRTGDFDVVSLLDVIEHVLPEDVEPSLREIARIARRHVLISASTRPATLAGVDLHPSYRPEPEWDALFRSVFRGTVTKVGGSADSPLWRIDLHP